MKYWLGFGGVALMLTVAGCGTQDTVTEEPEEDTVQEEATQDEATEAEQEETPAEGTSGDSHDGGQAAVDPYDYFLEDGSIARFEGYGNEFAEFTLKTDYMEANHVATRCKRDIFRAAARKSLRNARGQQCSRQEVANC